MADKLSSLDNGYQSGDLSVFPEAIDSTDELYEARNNAETLLTQSVTYNGSYFVVEDKNKISEENLAILNEMKSIYRNVNSIIKSQKI